MRGSPKGKASELPALADIAAALRAGETTLKELGATYGILPHSLRSRLSYSGWGSDGHPLIEQIPRLTEWATWKRPLWMVDAPCSTADPELFFPERGSPTRPAKAICRTCPLVPQCREYAIENEEIQHGVWGGTTHLERREERRRRRGLGDLEPEPNEIREWAREEGITVGRTGPIHADVRAAYDAAHAPQQTSEPTEGAA